MEPIEKLKRLVALYKNQRSLQYGVIFIYTIMWLFSSGSLSTTIWVGLGIGLGWILGKSERQE